MDIEAAKRFQEHAEQAIKELSSALALVRDTSSEHELHSVAKLMGEIIVRIDEMLYESIYGDHPELHGYGEKR
jgi:hypothetical protein